MRKNNLKQTNNPGKWKVLKLLNIFRKIRVEIAFRKKMLFKKLDGNQSSWELTTY